MIKVLEHIQLVFLLIAVSIVVTATMGLPEEETTLPVLRTICATPSLYHSQLRFRIGLARKRTASYPLDSMDFIMTDLERPDLRSRFAYYCTGDLTGRLLEFLSCAEGIDQHTDERLPVLFERILRQRRPSGLFGRYASGSASTPPEDNIFSGASRLFPGLIRYYELTGDWRALEAATGIAERLLSVKDAWDERLQSQGLRMWVSEPFARLYGLTGDNRYLDFCKMINEHTKRGRHHAHGFLSTLCGLQLAAYYTGDMRWNEKPEYYRQLLINEHHVMPDGCVAELILPNNSRNEGCAIADWLMLNLNAGLLLRDQSAYEQAERTLWNALFFNQFVTGGFGVRSITAHGYGMDELQEAWWCCTHTCGRAMTEYARHAVTFRQDADTICINFLVPGSYKLSVPGQPDIQVVIRTNYPATAEAVIEAAHVRAGVQVEVRIPEWIYNAQLDEQRQDDRVRIALEGRIRHQLVPYEDGGLLTYGPLILAPLRGVPRGSIPELLCEADAQGFVTLKNRPVTQWGFGEGPGARCAVGEAAVNVPVRINGEDKIMRFWPLCYNTADLIYEGVPIIFRKPE